MRLREPAAWLLVAAAGTTVLVGVIRLVFGDSSPLGGAAEFGIRSVVALSELTSPVNAALVVGAVFLSTRFGAPTPKSGLITMGGAGTLAVATLFGAISLLGSLFSGLGFGGKLETLLLGVPTFALTGLALLYVLTMVSPLPAGAVKPKKSRRLSVVPPAIPFPQTGDAHPVQNLPAEPDYSPYPQGPVFDQNGYAGQQVVEETPLPPVTPVAPAAQRAEPYDYPEPVYDDTPASWDSSPFSGFSGPQFARQAYEPPAAEAPAAPRPPVIETPFDSSVLATNETVYGAPVLEPSYEPPARESAYATQPPVYGAPYEPGYEGDIREQQLAQAYQQAQSYQQQPDAYRQSNPFGQPPARPQRYQGDPLSDPLRAEDLLDPIDPVAIYRPAKTGEGLPADPASLDSDATAHWYSPDRRDR